MAIAVTFTPVHPMSSFMHMSLFQFASSSWPCIYFLPTSDPAASTLHSSILCHHLPLCCLSWSQDPSSPISWLKTPAVPQYFYPFITLPTFHSSKKQKSTSQIPSLPFWANIETGIRTAYFSVYAGCLHMALFAHSSLSTLWGWCHLFTPS